MAIESLQVRYDAITDEHLTTEDTVPGRWRWIRATTEVRRLERTTITEVTIRGARATVLTLEDARDAGELPPFVSPFVFRYRLERVGGRSLLASRHMQDVSTERWIDDLFPWAVWA